MIRVYSPVNLEQSRDFDIALFCFYFRLILKIGLNMEHYTQNFPFYLKHFLVYKTTIS